MNYHNFEELPDALEYYLVNPDSDLKADLTDPDMLDQSGLKIPIKANVYMTLLNLLDWAKCFLATYGEYPSLYDLLDTPKRVLFSLNIHLHDPTFPRPLLPRSRGFPTP